MRCALAAATLGLLTASAGAAEPPRERLPGVETEVVRLDAVVTDRAGHLVRDLTQEDFALSEDGKPQRLTHFLFVGRSLSAPASPAAAGEEATATPAPAESVPSRQIVVLVDDLHIAPGNLQYTKEALRHFVDEATQPDDYIALVTTGSPGGVQKLMRDRAPLKQAIESLSVRDTTGPAATGSQVTPAQAEMILRGDRQALRLAARTFLDDPGSPYVDVGIRAAALAARGHIPADLDPSEAVAADEALRQARGILAEALHFSTVTLARLEDVVRGLSSMRGRKLCLLVSDGFLVGAGTPLERVRELRQVIDAATRSGTVVYALDARGVATMTTDASSSTKGATAALQQMVTRQSEVRFLGTLEDLAGDTGGFLVHGTNDLASGLRRMMEDNTAYYLLAYEPSNQKRDGRFRRIELKLPAHPQYTVRTRKGYLAPGERNRERGSEFVDLSPEAPATPPALDGLIPTNGVPVQLTVDYLDLPPDGSQAVVRAHVDVGALVWTESGGRQRAKLDLVGAFYDAVGVPVGSAFGTERQLDVAPDELEQLKRLGLQYQHRLPMRPGRYRVRLVVRGPDGAPLGGSERWVDIPDLGEKKLAMSSVFLSAERQAAGSGARELLSGGPGMRDAHSLRRFRSKDQLYFQFYVYNALTDERRASNVVFQAQIWSGTRALAASSPKATSLQIDRGVPLPETNGIGLEGLAPGHYDLRVVVVDRKANATVSRDVDFTIE